MAATTENANSATKVRHATLHGVGFPLPERVACQQASFFPTDEDGL
ncbi:hypothetical protein [Devriesea agamarum]|nr:hypothetical protein [Devriesea agamarum]